MDGWGFFCFCVSNLIGIFIAVLAGVTYRLLHSYLILLLLQSRPSTRGANNQNISKEMKKTKKKRRSGWWWGGGAICVCCVSIAEAEALYTFKGGIEIFNIGFTC